MSSVSEIENGAEIVQRVTRWLASLGPEIAQQPVRIACEDGRTIGDRSSAEGEDESSFAEDLIDLMVCDLDVMQWNDGVYTLVSTLGAGASLRVKIRRSDEVEPEDDFEDRVLPDAKLSKSAVLRFLFERLTREQDIQEMQVRADLRREERLDRQDEAARVRKDEFSQNMMNLLPTIMQALYPYTSAARAAQQAAGPAQAAASPLLEHEPYDFGESIRDVSRLLRTAEVTDAAILGRDEAVMRGYVDLVRLYCGIVLPPATPEETPRTSIDLQAVNALLVHPPVVAVAARIGGKGWNYLLRTFAPPVVTPVPAAAPGAPSEEPPPVAN